MPLDRQRGHVRVCVRVRVCCMHVRSQMRAIKARQRERGDELSQRVCDGVRQPDWEEGHGVLVALQPLSQIDMIR